jgi:hypothetical protein
LLQLPASKTTVKKKEEIIMNANDEVLKLLASLIASSDFQLEKTDYDNHNQSAESICTTDMKNVEMLTVKEAIAAVDGLSQYTLRLLLKQGKINYIRAGAGQRGKILINKKNLLQYFEKS